MKRLSGIYRRLLRAPIRRRELSRMYHGGDDTGRRLAEVIVDTRKRVFGQEEDRSIDAIETLRNELASTDETISHTDYGAGEPSECATADEMSRGKARTTALAHLCQHTCKKYPWSHLLLKLIREFKPTACLELGTCLGFSSAYVAAALELNGSGKLVTLEGAEPFAAIARRNFQKLSLNRVEVCVGRFQDTLDDVLRTHGPFGFAFIDGHHDGDATVAYFEQILPALSPDALVVFDDILWYESMREAWKTIEAHHRVRLSIDLGVMGVCAVNASAGTKHRFSFRL